jgi:hypothetical protein
MVVFETWPLHIYDIVAVCKRMINLFMFTTEAGICSLCGSKHVHALPRHQIKLMFPSPDHLDIYID